jgi:hypothetical protein
MMIGIRLYTFPVDIQTVWINNASSYVLIQTYTTLLDMSSVKCRSSLAMASITFQAPSVFWDEVDALSN